MYRRHMWSSDMLCTTPCTHLPLCCKWSCDTRDKCFSDSHKNKSYVERHIGQHFCQPARGLSPYPQPHPHPPLALLWHDGYPPPPAQPCTSLYTERKEASRGGGDPPQLFQCHLSSSLLPLLSPLVFESLRLSEVSLSLSLLIPFKFISPGSPRTLRPFVHR